MKLKTVISVNNLETWQELRRYTSVALGDIVTAINGRLSFSDNCQTSVARASFVGANMPTVVEHGLGIIPNGYIPVGLTADIRVFDVAGKVANKKTITLQASGAGAARILFF